jgi:hypothetical protein
MPQDHTCLKESSRHAVAAGDALLVTETNGSGQATARSANQKYWNAVNANECDNFSAARDKVRLRIDFARP